MQLHSGGVAIVMVLTRHFVLIFDAEGVSDIEAVYNYRRQNVMLGVNINTCV